MVDVEKKEKVIIVRATPKIKTSELMMEEEIKSYKKEQQSLFNMIDKLIHKLNGGE